jgi:hypothetical protein
MVEDIDGEIILSSESFVFRQRYAEEHSAAATVLMFEPAPPNYCNTSASSQTVGYMLKVVSLSPPNISFSPKSSLNRLAALLELRPLLCRRFTMRSLRRSTFSSIQTFNKKFQTKVFQALYTSGENGFRATSRGMHRALPKNGRVACGGVEKEIWTNPGRQRNCSAYWRDERGSPFSGEGWRYGLHSPGMLKVWPPRKVFLTTLQWPKYC